MKSRGAAFAVLAALCCAAAGAAPRPKPVDIWLWADITIDKNGRITALEWTEAEPSRKLLATSITPRVQAWEFVPALVDGQPMETRTGLGVGVRATVQDDGGVALQVTDAHTGPKSSGMTPPAYPSDGVMAGLSAEVVVELEIQTDGRPQILSMKFDGSGGPKRARKSFLQATEKAVRSWIFQPEIVANRAVKTRMQVPVTYCLGEDPWCAKQEARRKIGDPPANIPVALDSAVAFKTDFRAAAIP